MDAILSTEDTNDWETSTALFIPQPGWALPDLRIIGNPNRGGGFRVPMIRTTKTREEMQMESVTYLAPMLFVMGTVGNVLSFLVLYKRKKNTTTEVYLLLLALLDQLAIMVGLPRYWVKVTYDVDIREFTNWGL